MEIDLRQEKARLREEKERLEVELANAVGTERRRLRVNIALIDEQLLDCQTEIRQKKQQAEKVKKAAAAAEMSSRKRAAQLAAREEANREDAYFHELLCQLQAADQPQGEHATLQEMAKSYRTQVDALRHRIQLVSELRPRRAEEQSVHEERLRILKAMYRDTRDIAVILERYYDTGYHRNERYRI